MGRCHTVEHDRRSAWSQCGAGKSTLMNVLAHRNIAQVHVQIAGTVEVNGCPIGIDISSLSAYIQQEDLFFGTLTVREHLSFQAALQMEKHTPEERRRERVKEVMVELGLNKCADTFIGIPGRLRGISGVERKRLAFASEVLTNPPLLFADEPTSGLDAFMAQSLISSLQHLAANGTGHTIMCTIHQPSSEVYAMFDSILLLAEGRTAYMGSAADAITYFTSLGYPCPVNFNPADYFVHTLAIVPRDEEQCKDRVKEICNAYREQEATTKEETGLNKKPCTRQESFTVDTHFRKRSPYKASWCRQLGAVLWRTWITNNRDVLIFRIRIFQAIMTALIAGLIYLQIPYDQDGIQNIAGVYFFLVTSASFNSLQGVIFVFPFELPVFLREHKNGMYRTDVYYLAKTLSEVPIFIITPLLLSTISYWMIGLRQDFWHFLVCYGVVALLTNVAVSFGYIISTIAPTIPAATSLGPPLMLPLLIFGGFFLKNTTVPVYFVWLKYISWFMYGFEALIINQWKDFGPIDCDLGANTTGIQTSAILNSSFGGVGGFCIPNGNEAIKFLGFDKDNLSFDIYCLLALLVGFRLISFLFLLRRAYKEQ
ncbi:protein white-like isoform X2 [Oculina patagonica]